MASSMSVCFSGNLPTYYCMLCWRIKYDDDGGGEE